ncbi:MAG: oligopeptide/dipeptide ABC transporter ATP-binding protein [Microvirga sp.]
MTAAPLNSTSPAIPPMIEARKVGVTFQVSRGFLGGRRPLRAVQDVDLRVGRGETLAIVGESGSGKTTLANAILNLAPPTSGEILFAGEPVAAIGRKAFARQVQPVFQDPYSSLNPRRSVGATITQPLAVHAIGTGAERERRLRRMLDLVGLPGRAADALPHQLSGGQRQRVAIARALIVEPKLLVCDEPTSALDVSVQAQILNLLQDLRAELGLTYILITHNLAVVEHIASRVAVMYLGRVVEEASVDDLFRDPKHPYTVALLRSALTPDPDLGLPDLGLSNVFPNPIDPPGGCHFHPRCNRVFAPCGTIPPRPILRDGHRIACHLYDPDHGTLPTSKPPGDA